jgi:DNA-binding CsgD family transcriptional regulator
MADSARIAMLTAAAVDSLGTNDFYDRLLALLGTAAPHDLAALVRYAKSGPPDMILPRVVPTAAMVSYSGHFYAFDPFFLHWMTHGQTGVYQLSTLAPGLGGSRYAREFLKAMSIADEIAVFLPPLGDSAPTLILDRASANFTAREVANVRALFPLLAALQRRHLAVFVASGGELALSPIGNERPLRITDQHGAVVHLTRAWAERQRALGPRLDAIGDRGPCLMPLGGGESLKRTRLPPDFGPAPGGTCDEIVPDRAEPAPSLPLALTEQLTPREAEVVALTLRGYPVIEIARRMGVSRGTVKNHRAAIYRKLDITTERELFGEFLRAQGLELG